MKKNALLSFVIILILLIYALNIYVCSISNKCISQKEITSQTDEYKVILLLKTS